jgi:hypothetical protein
METENRNILLITQKEVKTIEERIRLIENSVILNPGGSRIFAVDRDNPALGTILKAALMHAFSFGDLDEAEKIEKEIEVLNSRQKQ